MTAPALELLFEATTIYEGESAMVASPGDGRRIWGGGTGTVAGPRISGSMWWCNHARRNADGVWHPDIHGFIRTDDGAEILVDFAGYSVPNEDDSLRTVSCAVWFQTEAEPYDWLNYTMGVMRGTFTPQDGTAPFAVYAVTA